MMYCRQGVRRWGKRYGTQVFHKGVVLPGSVWKQLNSEQIALVELLILVRCIVGFQNAHILANNPLHCQVRCKAFVGMIYSTFSVFIVESRKLEGYDPRNNGLVGAEGFYKAPENVQMMNGTAFTAFLS